MAWCHQAKSHYLNRGWPSSMTIYGLSRPQWVYSFSFLCYFRNSKCKGIAKSSLLVNTYQVKTILCFCGWIVFALFFICKNKPFQVIGDKRGLMELILLTMRIVIYQNAFNCWLIDFFWQPLGNHFGYSGTYHIFFKVTAEIEQLCPSKNWWLDYCTSTGSPVSHSTFSAT